MATEGGGGENVMLPRGALCGCCENTSVGRRNGVFGCWSEVGRSRLSSFLRECPRGSSCGIGWKT